MGFARTCSVALVGVEGVVVEVQAGLEPGVAAFTLVGLPDKSLVESRDRVRSAIVNSGESWPQKKLTVGLSPATVPKGGSGFDLSVACAVLAAGERIAPREIAGLVMIGELGLDGRVHPVRGVLPAMLAASEAGYRRVVVAREATAEAALVPGVSVLGVRSLRQLVALLNDEPAPVEAEDAAGFGVGAWDGPGAGDDSGPGSGSGSGSGSPDGAGSDGSGESDGGSAGAGAGAGSGSGTGPSRSRAWIGGWIGPAAPGDGGADGDGAGGEGDPAGPGGALGAGLLASAGLGAGFGTGPSGSEPPPDMADVAGQAQARLALEVAAAGGHHVFLSGPPGAGKTMLAVRLPGLLPPLTPKESLEVTAVHSVAGLLTPGRPAVDTAPFCAPHHSATMQSLVGGGNGLPRPGACSLAHRGVLFLDEAPEFASRALEALRQPLESGHVVIARAAGVVRLPARFQLVLAANPCPCGRHGSPGAVCECSPGAVRRYQARLSGPLLDRVDLRVTVDPVDRCELITPSGSAESTAAIAARVREARARAAARYAGLPWRLNAEVPGHELRTRWAPSGAALHPAERDMERGLLSARGLDRVLRVSWTLADLAGRPHPDAEDVRLALQLRTGVTRGVPLVGSPR
jgi:magnesium chelatase family protein